MAITLNEKITASDIVNELNGKASSKHSHTQSDITDLPTVPTKTSQLINDSGFLTSLPDLAGTYLKLTGGTCTGNIYAPGFYISSSRKVKENIYPTKVNGEDMINSINVVDFNYIDDESHAPKVGFIAEDTNPLFSTKERKVMDSANCIGILIKAVQELSMKIKFLEKQILEIKGE